MFSVRFKICLPPGSRYNWTIILPAELSAAAILINFWNRDTSLNPAWITICMVVVIVINFMGAG